MKIIKVKHCPRKTIDETFIKAIYKLKELGITLDTVEYISIPLRMIGCLNFHGVFNRAVLTRVNIEDSKVFIVCMINSGTRPTVAAIIEIDYDLY